MKLTIFGGTGKTGQHLVRQALDAGHQVTILARDPSKLTVQSANLSVVRGDIREAHRVAEAVKGADAVLSVLGPSSNKPEFIISTGIDHLLNAMASNNVRRLVISTGAGVRDPKDKPKMIDRVFGLLLNILSKNVVADMKQTIDKVRRSDLDWTVVRAPRLTDEPAHGNLKVGYVGDTNTSLSRADMAAFMLKQVDDPTYSRQAPAISN